MTLLRTNRVLHEICIEIKVSASDFLRGTTKEL
nr:MAG TPA: DNA repair protein MmcB-like protein [Bacteriophage sp.]